MDDVTRQRIQDTISKNDIVLFMKGTPAAPRCGFSASVVQILDGVGVPYASVDVLSDADVREGIKEFSDWPTIPQLYVKKEFIGGADIVKEMYGSGELEEKLGKAAADVPPPAVTVTPRAAKALSAALESAEEGVRLEIDARYVHGLSVGEKRARDVVVVSEGVTLLLDRASASRAAGTVIDHVDTPDGPAFKIQNPNEPAKVKQVGPRDLSERIARGEAIHLFDVRTPAEREVVTLANSTLLDREAQDRIRALPKDAPLVFFCHHGPRSQQAAEFFLEQGFSNVSNLAGGIDAWSVEVDPGVRRY